MDKYTDYCPVIFPLYGTGDQSELDRIQSIDPTGTTNWEKQKEVGSNFVGWAKKTPKITYRANQAETGSIEPWNKLANKADDNTVVTEADFKNAWVDICSYITDDDGTFLETLQLPKLRVSGFNIEIPDTDTALAKSYDLVGESWIAWQNNNQYVVMIKVEVASGDLTGDDLVMVIGDGDYSNYPDPVADEDRVSESETKQYIQKITKVSAVGVNSELDAAVGDYSYVATSKTLTITNAEVGDIYKVFYTAATYRNDATVPFVKNVSKSGGLMPECVTAYLYIPASASENPDANDILHLVQGITIGVTLDRTDKKEVGSKEVKLRGVKDVTVSVTISRFLETLKIEELLRGKTPSDNYGKLDLSKFLDSATLVVDVYSDDTKANKLLSYKIKNLAPSEVRGPGIAVGDYANQALTLTADNITITDES